MTVALAFAALLAIDCDCDPKRPETLTRRECSLCNEAEKQPPGTEVFFLKDINPRKPNRWLVLPRRHASGAHHLHDLTLAERTALWTAAIAKAREMWGDQWGIAYNGEKVRTQCHTHLHIGKLLPSVIKPGYIEVSHPSQIPAPPGSGIWVYPHGKKLRVHTGEQICETVLMR